MRILVLLGTHHVGRAIVERALASGDDVTTLTRGESGPPVFGASARFADRTDPVALGAALSDDEWDAVVDTWSLAPRVVRDSARPRRAAGSTCPQRSLPAPAHPERRAIGMGAAAEARLLQQ
ncbi:MAG TPA: hypothetical protein VFW55_08175 [Propionicimonas sp.]|nr:hypothetical protein [Propionicimonas sp.]